MLVKANRASSKSARRELARRLEAFYADNVCYYAEAAESEKEPLLVALLPIIKQLLRSDERVCVLEIGAGMSQLPEFLYRHFSRHQVSITAHDINDINSAYYSNQGIATIFGPLEEISGKYDLIVSFFVYEHVPEPVEFLNKIDALLEEGGYLCFVCPKYTMPLYVPPALRHFQIHKQLRLNFQLVVSSMLSRLTGRPNFWVETEPAVFSRAWTRDSDAVHMVSSSDLLIHLRPKYVFERYEIPLGRGLRGWLRPLMMLSVAARKRGDAT